MRLAIRFHSARESRLPINHHYELTGLVYRLLGESNADFARFLHDEGYATESDPARRFKLFVFSTLRVPKSRRRIEGDRLRIAPGAIDWFLSSPREDFLTHSATGLLSVGTEVHVGEAPLVIAEVQALAEPVFTEVMPFSCLTPIVASIRRDDGSTHYLRPNESEAFSEAVRRNALRKYALLHGAAPEDDRLSLEFDAAYLARAPHGGTKCVSFKGIQIVGVQAPFTLSGNPELIRVGYTCGLGEKNSAGFGMVEVVE